MSGFDFDIDPLKSDPLKGFRSGNSVGGSLRRPVYRQQLSPDDYKSAGQQALDAGSSGVSHILGALDKPGQAVRGVLAGKGLGSLKHLVPFSDTIGLTTEGDHTTGRDLTDKYGLTSKRDKGWGAWGAGLAADIATDPLTYTTFGAKHALTPIGAAVKKTGALKGFTGRQMLAGFHGAEPALAAAGRTPEEILHLTDQGNKIASGVAAATGVEAGQPLGSLVRFGLPFGVAGVNIGTGQAAQKIAGGLDQAGDFLKYGNPIGRAIGAKFDATRHGAVGAATQRGASQYLDPALRELNRDSRDDRFGLIQHLDPLVSAGAHDERTITDAARAVAEGVNPGTSGVHAQVAPAARHVLDVGKRQIGEARQAGASIKDVNDEYVNYVHRSAFPESPGQLQLGGMGSKPQPILPTTSGANIGRDEVFRDIPGGTGRINNWFDRFAGGGHKATIIKAVKQDLLADHAAVGGQMTQQIDLAFDKKAAAMADRLKSANPAYRSTPASATADAVPGKPFFSPDIVSDVTQRGNQHAKTVANSKAAIGILGDNARPFVAGSDMVPLSVAMGKLGLGTYAADVAAGTPMEGALVQMYRGLAKHGAGPVDPFLMGKTSAIKKQVNKFGVTKEHFDELTKAHAGWKAPEEIKSTLGAFDSITNAFKGLAYPIWMPSHVRNAGTAFVNNLRHGVGLRDMADQMQVMTGRGARDLSGIHPSISGLPAAQQSEALRRLQYGAANIFGGNGMNEEIAGNVRSAIEEGKRFTPYVPGSDRAGNTGSIAGDAADLVLRQGLGGSIKGVANAAAGSLAGLLDPTRKWGQSIAENLGIKGVGGASKDTLAAVNAGRKVGTNVEDFFRGALFNKLSRGGSAPGVAADAIDALHFDYDALTSFEKNVMRRAMPFYTFARKNLPLQLDTLAHQPGILQAQSKPLNQEGPDGKGYVPKYLNSGYAIPIGAEQDGSRQYVSKLGLPAEEAFEKLHFQNGLPDVGRTALAQLGGLNPLIKAPIEQLFNTQFHTQRQLTDLHAPQAASAVGRMFGDDNPQLLSQVMSNSPFTRFISSTDKLMDPRKSWAQKAINLATGVRVTDVNTDKQRAIDTRQALEEIMRGHPNLSRYSSFYVKPDDVQDLTPEEIGLMQAYSTQQAQAKSYAKAQRIGLKP